jgi:UDP-perosamine 4-acetyltransferase
VVSPSASIGRGVAIMAGVVVNANAAIDDLAIVNTGATIDHDCSIGVAAHIAPQSGLAGNVVVGACSFLGIGTKVIPGCRIGSNVMIGAGGVVISDVADGVTAVGVPIRVLTDSPDEERM